MTDDEKIKRVERRLDGPFYIEYTYELSEDDPDFVPVFVSVANGRVCLEQKHGWSCTLEKGHLTHHAAHIGSRLIAIWND